MTFSSDQRKMVKEEVNSPLKDSIKFL